VRFLIRRFVCQSQCPVKLQIPHVDVVLSSYYDLMLRSSLKITKVIEIDLSRTLTGASGILYSTSS